MNQHSLPEPSTDAQAASRELSGHIADRIEAAGGWLPFVNFMDMALHLPGLGYYAGGSLKFGAEGDFITAPEITPLFGQTLARQVREILAILPIPTKGFPAVTPTILEVGAGSGRLAADILLALEALERVAGPVLHPRIVGGIARTPTGHAGYHGAPSREPCFLAGYVAGDILGLCHRQRTARRLADARRGLA